MEVKKDENCITNDTSLTDDDAPLLHKSCIIFGGIKEDKKLTQKDIIIREYIESDAQ